MPQNPPTAPTRAPSRPLPLGALWLGLAIVAGWPLFRLGVTGLAEAWARPEFSHGPVIPVLSLYLFLHEMKAVPPPRQPVADRWPGVLVTAAALLLALAGNLAGIDHLVFYALILWTAGLVLVAFGWRRGRGFWPSVLHLVFMLPLPQFLYWKLTTTLQLVSSAIGVQLVGLAGIPVYLDGNIIDLGVIQLQVAEACSGLAYLFPIMSFTYVFAVLYRGPLWHKLVLLLLAVPIAIAMNALRIGAIGILVDRFGVAQAEGFLHVFEGWVVFLACLAAMGLLAKALQRLTGDRRRLGEALDVDFSGLGAQLGRLRGLEPSPALALTALLTLGLGLGWSLAPARELAPPARQDFASFPLDLADWAAAGGDAGDGGRWQGTPAPLTPALERILGADDYLSALYVDPAENPAAAAPVDLFLSFYARQTAGNAVHSPEVCLPGAGWEIATLAVVPVEVAGERFAVNRAVIRKGAERQLVWYWFEGRGRRLTGDFAVKGWTLLDSLRDGRSDGGLVRLITPIRPAPAGGSEDGGGEAAAPAGGKSEDGGEAAADARLARFLAASLREIPRFIPN
ncbi:MAG TPA: VPLPA-CTERM-specific exosortase XrtD [Amaricoccus sp.]|nr:VPLPA-CTERM-specific exosortase XrtD [Amaricoccus sp.]